MTTFPRSPRLLKGAIVTVSASGRPDTAIIFQFNPEKMSRRLEARVARGSESSDRAEALRLEGPARETITLQIQLDASDQFANSDPETLQSGLLPALSALELLLHPSVEQIRGITRDAGTGALEIIPPEKPLTLFVWGEKRVLPVRLTSLSINEETFDPLLNPIQAEVDLSLEVLTTHDFRPEHPGYAIYMTHLVSKEVLGKIALGRDIADIGFTLRLP